VGEKFMFVRTMRRGFVVVALAVMVMSAFRGVDQAGAAGTSGKVVAWGDGTGAFSAVPTSVGDFTAIAAGVKHSLGLK